MSEFGDVLIRKSEDFGAFGVGVWVGQLFERFPRWYNGDLVLLVGGSSWEMRGLTMSVFRSKLHISTTRSESEKAAGHGSRAAVPAVDVENVDDMGRVVEDESMFHDSFPHP